MNEKLYSSAMSGGGWLFKEVFIRERAFTLMFTYLDSISFDIDLFLLLVFLYAMGFFL